MNEILFIEILYVLGQNLLVTEFDGFRLPQQLFIPALAGGVGGLSLMVMASLSHYGEFSLKDFYKVYIKLAVLGGIAGIAAVNLLNPDGNISQVMILGLIAGLSGFSYLKRNSLVDSIYEDAFLKKMKKNVVADGEKFLGNINKEDRKEERKEGDEQDVVDQSEFEDDEESEDEVEDSEERGSEAEQPDAERVVQYIDGKVGEWILEHPNSTEEEMISYYDQITQEVLENPKLIEFEE